MAFYIVKNKKSFRQIRDAVHDGVVLIVLEKTGRRWLVNFIPHGK